MNYIEQGFLVEAQRELDGAAQALENHADNGPPALVGAAYHHILRARGALAALRQMVDLYALERAATERPVDLRIVPR